jgi:hypothetical protein
LYYVRAACAFFFAEVIEYISDGVFVFVVQLVDGDKFWALVFERVGHRLIVSEVENPAE